MSIIPNRNPLGDSPLTALSTPPLSQEFAWKETPEAHVLRAEMPGLKKEEVKIEVEDGRVLHVTGERNVEKQEDNDGCHRVQRSSSKFKKCFTLPPNAKEDQVMASLDNGLLTVTAPKITPVNHKAIENSY